MRFVFLALLLPGIFCASAPLNAQTAPFKRVVILKVDGLNGQLLQDTMQQRDAVSGKSRLPWFSHVFQEQGVVFRNFYTRGISLSAPSWSMLDTGEHSVIRGNVEYDRYTGQVFDYLNFFPFYFGYARGEAVDMPGVEVLDRAGIPLLIDRFRYEQVFQSFQLFQRGVSWNTLIQALSRTFSGKALFSFVESAAPLPLGSSLSKQIESELLAGISGSSLLYLDLYTGEADHEGHATSDPAGLLHVMQELDGLVGQIWTAIQKSPFAQQTLLVVVSDHGMNNVPNIVSQTFSLPDVFNSEAGGGHHVVTDREQLSDFKLKGINPLVRRVITPSNASFYLKDEASKYPTAWLDIDGNERTAVHLRNNDLNKVHILLLQLARNNLSAPLRKAAAEDVARIIEAHRERWTAEVNELSEELRALDEVIEQRREVLRHVPRRISAERHRLGEDKVTRRLRRELQAWQNEEAGYKSYVSHVTALLAFHPDETRRFGGNVETLIAPLTLGDNNTVGEIQHYVVGPSAAGLAIDAGGHLDEEQSFRYVDYFSLLSQQKAKNNPQPQLSQNPIDFTAMRLPDGQYATTDAPQHAYFLYGDEGHQIVVLQDLAGNLLVEPVSHLRQTAARVSWMHEPWTDDLPLRLFEDSNLQIPPGEDRARWLSRWHSERDWFAAIHKCKYSNGVIGITEELSAVGPDVPGRPGVSPVLCRYEKRRRELVQADFHVFAADHWNFNVRFPNPGGNHGAFFRISTHSVWMMAGGDLPARQIDEPYDSLNFASTVLNLLGRTPPMPERVVSLR